MNRITGATAGLTRSTALALAGILLGAAALNVWNIGFPLGFHIDEPIKVNFIQQGDQDFKHPLLMLQAVRAARLVWPADDPQAIVVLGRSLQALCGVGTVLLAFLLARRAIGDLAALAVAAATAVSPLLVIHAHYLKEDTVLTLWLSASLLALVAYARAPGWQRAVWIGLASGLAFSSHWKSILLVPLVGAAPLLGALHDWQDSGRTRRVWTFYRHMLVAGLVATTVFVAVNWPMFRDVRVFATGIAFEARHAALGQDILIRPWDYGFTFYLRHILAPNLGWPGLALALAGLTWVLLGWRRAGFQMRLLAAYVVLFYLVSESSPLKSMRYMVPVIPALIQLAWWGVSRAAGASPPRAAAILAAAAAIVMIALPLALTLRLTASIDNDTREQAAAWLRQHPGKAIIEEYGGVTADVLTAAEVDLARARQDGVAYIVASNFRYGRFFAGAALPNQDPDIYRIHQQYVELFKYPYVEFRPAFLTYGFHNPIVRIVDIRTPR